MKKLTAILFTAMTMAAVLTGCGSSTADTTPAEATEAAAAVDETADTVETAEETEAETNALTLEEAVAKTPGVQGQIEMLSDTMGIEVEVSGNTMIYKFPLGMDIDEDTRDAIIEQLEAGVEEQLDSFTSMKEGLEEEAGVTGITLVISYLDNDGNEVYSKTID